MSGPIFLALMLAQAGSGLAEAGPAAYAPPPVMAYLGAIYFLLLMAGLVALLAGGDLVERVRSGSGWLQWRPWTIRHLFICVAGYCAISALGSAFIVGGDKSSLEDPAKAAMMLALTLLIQVGSLGLIVLLVRHRAISWRDGFGWGNSSMLTRLKGIAGFLMVSYCLFIPVILVVTILLKYFDIEPATQDVLTMLSTSESPVVIMLILVLAAVGAPITEELFFRGLFLPVLARRMGTVPAVMLVSLIFCLIHLNITAAAPLFILAVSLSIAYLYTRNILVPIVMHVLFNSVSLLMAVQ